MSTGDNGTTSPARNMASYIPELDGLRALLALWVVVGHVFTSVSLDPAPLPRNLGNVSAVDIFIILSGFVISNLRWSRPEPYGLYIARRGLRLFPSYLLALAASLAMLGVTRDALLHGPASEMRLPRLEFIDAAQNALAPHLIAHALLLQGMIPDRLLPYTAYTLIGQAWSVSMEWQFYLIAPLLLLLPRAGGRWIGIPLLLALAGALARIRWPGFIGGKIEYFLIGIGSFYLWRWCLAHPRYVTGAGARIVVVLACLAILVAIPDRFPLALWIAVLYGLTLRRLAPGRAEARACGVLLVRPVQWLGVRSYSAYLWHMVGLAACMAILNRLSLPPLAYTLSLLAGTLASTMVISALCYRFAEKPAINFGRGLSANRQYSAPSTVSETGTP